MPDYGSKITREGWLRCCATFVSATVLAAVRGVRPALLGMAAAEVPLGAAVGAAIRRRREESAHTKIIVACRGNAVAFRGRQGMRTVNARLFFMVWFALVLDRKTHTRGHAKQEKHARSHTHMEQL